MAGEGSSRSFRFFGAGSFGVVGGGFVVVAGLFVLLILRRLRPRHHLQQVAKHLLCAGVRVDGRLVFVVNVVAIAIFAVSVTAVIIVTIGDALRLWGRRMPLLVGVHAHVGKGIERSRG